MNIQIIKGIQLPAFDLELLTSSKLIFVPFRQYARKGEFFWLYPSQELPDNLTLEQYYQPEYVSDAKFCFDQCSNYPLQIKAWGLCEDHLHINSDQKHLLAMIAQLSAWNLTALEHIFNRFQVLKLLIMRVYFLPSPCIVNEQVQQGYFYWPKPGDVITTSTNSDIPVVSNVSFHRRISQFLSGEIYQPSIMETLQAQVEAISLNNITAKAFNEQIQVFLGWQETKPMQISDPELIWIKDRELVTLGDRSKEKDEGKSNYQAGTDFENIARQGLEFLGFTVDQAYRGGAGGLDIFCSNPYPLTIECKAGKKIPSGTTEELIKLGGMRLGADKFLMSSKLIIGPGDPTSDVITAAQEWRVSIIKPMSLQKLVELKAKFSGSINLLELKKYLESGQIDQKIDEFIQKVEAEIRLRSHIIQLAKNANKTVGIDYLCGVYDASNPIQSLSDKELHEILIELSSPLTGYLGREKGSDWRGDRFYFLRDLPIEKET
jgi:Domain of unknown function (DUF1802)